MYSCAPPGGSGSPSSAKEFADKAEADLLALSLTENRSSWIQSTHITDDTEALAAAATEKRVNAAVRYAKEAAKYDSAAADPETRRKLTILKRGVVVATPADPKESAELTTIGTRMESTYGKGKYCPPGEKEPGKCKDVQGLSQVLARSTNPKEMLEAWTGWHSISPPIRADYVRHVELANKGARELGFTDTGAMWRSVYDMPPEAFTKEVDRLWEQVRPLYVSLHAYVRQRLNAKYGDAVVPKSGPVPAHLLGNMWAQSWDNLLPVLGGADPGFDLTKVIQTRKMDPKQMVKYGEEFYLSLGFQPLPQTFWSRSQFSKPRDREVVCHASAWNIDAVDDVRIKMCIEPTDEDLYTIYHELGHNYYQRAYNKLPFLFRDSANDAFHEAIGDTIQLSVTPDFLVKAGFLAAAPDASKDTGVMLKRALEKVAFLPFGLLIDQWRWKVYGGEIKPASYNQAWWDLRLKYQGVAPPVARSESDFDPGAKYHVPASYPYTRYFLAHILQFQFHRALAQKAGCDLSKTPLHRCSIYGNKDAGKALAAMLEMGAAKPWPDALEAMTGKREMDATAIIDYFAPLKKWLDEQNAGKPSGW
ncbi:MAG: M2 family metallopeptidase [Acidobacteria bacterium]|nr:M2 family metallopeptidase [Acidobacteriota bacterium]